MAVKMHPDAYRYPGSRIKAVLPPMDEEVCREVNETHACFAAGKQIISNILGLYIYISEIAD